MGYVTTRECADNKYCWDCNLSDTITIVADYVETFCALCDTQDCDTASCGEQGTCDAKGQPMNVPVCDSCKAIRQGE